MRRFAFIEVTSPPAAAFERLLDRPGGDVIAPLLAIRTVRDLGPAVFLDAARFAERRMEDGRTPSRVRYEAFRSFVLPQLDGCDDEEAKLVFELLAGAFDPEELHAVRRVIRAITPPPTIERIAS
jgi:hypothetical protein